jgi:hypothetical protein
VVCGRVHTGLGRRISLFELGVHISGVVLSRVRLHALGEGLGLNVRQSFPLRVVRIDKCISQYIYLYLYSSNIYLFIYCILREGERDRTIKRKNIVRERVGDVKQN